jgi:hypothetical protein
MKKLKVYKILYSLVFMFLFSCEKDTTCWECKIQQTTTKVIIQEYCDKTNAEIENIEAQNTFNHNLNGAWWHQTCVCKRK